MNHAVTVPSREQLLHELYEASELEHTLMCTYLYAAFGLKDGAEGLSAEEAAAVTRWRRTIIDVAIDEMGHLAAVWNITAALGGAPRFGRGNFPLDPGALPASVVVKLAPFNEAVLQHFIHLERPHDSTEPDGAGFAPEFVFSRETVPRLTPMACDYETVGDFYACLGNKLRGFVDLHGESQAFCGDPALQLSPREVTLTGARPVLCLKTALAAFQAIVEQGEGAPQHSENSHFRRFVAIREEFAALKQKNPAFVPSFPVAHNPVLRPPLRREGRVWLEGEAAEVVDVANTGYALMLRLLAYSYALRSPSSEKALAVDLSLALMRAVTLLAERAARLPAGPANPHCNAGVSFSALRDAASLPAGPSSRRFFLERLGELARAAGALPGDDARVKKAARILAGLTERATAGFDLSTPTASPPAPAPAPAATLAANGSSSTNGAPTLDPHQGPPVPVLIDGAEHIDAKHMTLIYEGKKCIHARHCVTGAPNVFLANVKGPWISPDAMEVEDLVRIAQACPSGAIRYRRKDERPDESAPPVNLIAVREGGPYAVRADIQLNGRALHYRATLCRCGASKNKPFCDGSHHDIEFSATGEPTTGAADMLPVRDGPLAIDPQVDGPLQIRGNLEITSGTGRVVARVTQARLCRCGASGNKPFCDGSHARIGFSSE